MNKKEKQYSVRCVFCEGGNLSKEHIWPNWVADTGLLEVENNPIISLINIKRKPGVEETLEEKSKKHRQGNTYGITNKVVCETCNNQWMSQIEQDVKPILLNLIKGEGFHLNISDQEMLSRWVTMKAIVLSKKTDYTSVFSREQVIDFVKNNKIPEQVAIWITKRKNGKMNCKLHQERGILIVKKENLTEKDKRNYHTIGIYFGKLFIFFVYEGRNCPAIRSMVYGYSMMHLISPVASPIPWPSHYCIDEDVIDCISHTIHMVSWDRINEKRFKDAVLIDINGNQRTRVLP